LEITLPVTIVIETVVLWLWQRRQSAITTWPLAGWLAALNALTQVLLAAGLVKLPFAYLTNLLLLEAAVMIVEGLALGLRLPQKQAFSLSLLANAASFGLGLLLPV
jgi:hypothetical protein